MFSRPVARNLLRRTSRKILQADDWVLTLLCVVSMDFRREIGGWSQSTYWPCRNLHYSVSQPSTRTWTSKREIATTLHPPTKIFQSTEAFPAVLKVGKRDCRKWFDSSYEKVDPSWTHGRNYNDNMRFNEHYHPSLQSLSLVNTSSK